MWTTSITSLTKIGQSIQETSCNGEEKHTDPYRHTNQCCKPFHSFLCRHPSQFLRSHNQLKNWIRNGRGGRLTASTKNSLGVRNKSFTHKCISRYEGKAKFGPDRAIKSCSGSIRKSCMIELASINLSKHTGYVMHQQVEHSTTVRSAYTIFMCFVFIWEQTATYATYSINLMVFTTEMESVYCAVRTGSLNEAFCASSVKG